MTAERPLFIPVILGTARQGRMSEHAARLVVQEVAQRPGVETELIDIRDLPLPTSDAGEAIKDRDFSAKMDRADALVIAAPEYNHSFPGLLKHALDSAGHPDAPGRLQAAATFVSDFFRRPSAIDVVDRADMMPAFIELRQTLLRPVLGRLASVLTGSRRTAKERIHVAPHR